MKRKLRKSRRTHLTVHQTSRVSVQYPDAERLEPNGGVGHVDHVNGPGARARREFIATQYELEELTRMWVRTRLDLAFFFHLYRTSGSREWREAVYADRRTDRLQRILGADIVNRITTEVEQEFRESFGDEEWERFLARR